MNRNRLLSAMAVLLAIQLACSFGGGGSSGGDKPIGSIRQLQGGVRAGPESALQDVTPSRDMYDNEAAQVYDQGKARLDYGYGITFTLYNDTSTVGTSVSASGQAKTRLAAGGLTGHNAAGSRTEVQLPNGGSVVILGTTYFIGYNAGTEVARVHNFDGTLQYSVGGGPFQDLPAGSLVTFDRTRVIEILPDLRFSPEELDKYATDADSPLVGLEMLLRDKRAAEPAPQEPPQAPPPNVQNPSRSLEGMVFQFTECRYGPGDAYLSRTVFKDGERIQVIGRDAGGRWIQATSGGGDPCWINVDLVKLEGELLNMPDTYTSPAALPLSPFAGKITVVTVEQGGSVLFVQWEGYDIPKELRQAGLVHYIVEVWTCVNGQPGFYALGTDDTAMKSDLDASCGAPQHADVIGQDMQGFSAPGEIFLK